MKKNEKSYPLISKATAKPGARFAWPGGWVEITRVYHMTEEEANKLAVYWLDRWEGVTDKGIKVGAAFHDGNHIQSSTNWSL